MRNKEYIVDIEQGRRTRSVVWSTAKPLALLHPAHWSLVSTDRGIRLVEQGAPTSKPRRMTVPAAALSGGRILVPAGPRSAAFSIRIRPMARPAALFAQKKTQSYQSWTNEASSEVLFCGVGDSLLNHRHVGSSFRIHVDNGLVFSNKNLGGRYQITSQVAGLFFCVPGKSPQPIQPGYGHIIEGWDFEQGTLKWNRLWWRIASIPDAESLAARIEEDSLANRESSAKGLGLYSGIAGMLLTIALIFSPSAPKVEKAKVVTHIELKAPKLVAALPKPPPPKPKPKPIVKKELPPPPKRIEPPPPKKVVEQPKPRPAKIAKRNVTPKPAPVAKAPAPAPAPKVAAKPIARPPARVASGKPAAPAPRLIERNVPTRPIAKATVPSISPEQMAAKQAAVEAAKAKAQLAQSLNFLSTSNSRPAAAMEADLIAEDANQKLQAKFRGGTPSTAITKTEGTYLSSLSSQGSAEGRRIETRSARRISADEDTSYGGDGRAAGSGQVRGKVAASALGSGEGSGVALGTSLGGGGLDVSGSGEVAEIDIEKALEKSLARFQYCYEKVLLSDASLAGTILMEWTIDGSGRGSSVKVVRSQLNSNPLHNCLSSELSRVQFPSPKGGAVIVKYPFAFSSGTL